MVSSNDDFYRNPVIKEFYKNHVKTMLNRVNTFTKVAYKDEPASMAWQLMNEPRCGVDRSGKTLMAWINEMALFVKSVDPNHLLSTGHEGGSAAGALFWEVISEGMSNFAGPSSIILSDKSSTVNIISEQTRKMGLLGGTKGK
ncbi:Glycoside hydrolase superfamily [Arabidopsis thaliana x Arabidopsis arenosa]|uniref:Glycoside hydrolase superfamily n=1 Tax=Arabidopsis thaliana x Arabidopsis arenosa TaxID=1240361 RepID=A0A8T2ET29_9BRAS|nr:Glycoside hydrolase superfamily [Arabidopsis thaliana x Arabidopsis arenosa]